MNLWKSTWILLTSPVSRRVLDLDDPRLNHSDQALALDARDPKFRRALYRKSPTLHLLGMILRQAQADEADAIEMFIDSDGHCLRILEHVGVGTDYEPLPWRTVDERDWGRWIQPRPEGVVQYYLVDCPVDPSSPKRAWVQMRPLGLAAAMEVLLATMTLSRTIPGKSSGVLHLRWRGAIDTWESQSPNESEVRLFRGGARPSPCARNTDALWDENESRSTPT